MLRSLSDPQFANVTWLTPASGATALGSVTTIGVLRTQCDCATQAGGFRCVALTLELIFPFTLQNVLFVPKAFGLIRWLPKGSIVMTKPIRILMQTTIPFELDNWHVGRFSLLRDQLASLKDEAGNPLYQVVTRDRELDAAGNDPVLSTLDTSDFQELWLFAIDTGDGLSRIDCEGITRFRQRGGGIMATRDHQDLGTSLCTLGGIGRAHYFHSKHPEPDPSRCVPDDVDTASISWPNYHSGANGDYQTIVASDHELMQNSSSRPGMIKFFPAHPHEGAVGVPKDEKNARVVAVGRSQATQREFNLIVAFETSTDDHGNRLGRGIADSSFHHFADYNWNTDMGCPSFLIEPPGDGYKRNPEALNDIKTYVGNAARWLAQASGQ